MNEVVITQYNKLIVNYDTYEFTPSNYKQIVINNPWYLNVDSAPDFIQNKTYELNNFKEFTVPSDTYSVSNYKIYRYTGTNTAKTINISNKSHYDLLKSYFNTLGSSAGNYIWNLSKMSQLKYYYLFHGHRAYGNGKYATFFNGTPTRNNSILIPVTNTNAATYTTFQEIPIITNISITFDSNTFALDLPEHRINGKTESSAMTSIMVPAGRYTCSQYHDLIKQVIPYSQTWDNSFTKSTMYQYPFCMTARRSGPIAWYCGDNTYKLFNELYCRLHLLYSSSATNYIAHACNGPATHRCLSCTSGVWNVDDFVNYVNTTDDEKLFGCISTQHEIFITTSMPFIINPVCSMTKLGEADITPEGSTDYTFETQKRIMYHPQYKQVNCTVTYNGTTYTISGRYTPAEFLRKLYEVTGLRCIIVNNNIICKEQFTISDNPFIEINGNNIINKCGIQNIKYNSVIQSKIKLQGLENNFFTSTLYNPKINLEINFSDNVPNISNMNYKIFYTEINDS